MVKIATQGGDGAVAFAQESVVITCTDAVAKGLDKIEVAPVPAKHLELKSNDLDET